MKTIDVSNFKSGQDFLDAVVGSGETCFMITGEDNNHFLSKMNKSEPVAKFKIGDIVRLDRESLEFNCASHLYKKQEFTVVGMELIGKRYLYTVRGENCEYKFFSYEIERVK